MLAIATRWISHWLAPAAFAGCCAVHLAGCVAIPVPTAAADPEPFSTERMTPIRIGQTTREEVRGLFANWTFETDDGTQLAQLEPQVSGGGRHWVFSLPRQVGDVAWVGFLLSPYGLVPGVFGKGDNYEDSWILFEFDDAATVARFWVTSGKRPCAAGGACYHGGHLQVIADAETSASAHASTKTSDRCAIYAYADKDFELPVTIADATHTGALLAQTSFVRFDVATGPATVSAWYENIPGAAASQLVNCASGDVHYLALRPREGLIEFKPVTAATGKAAIAKRFLVERIVAAQGSLAPERLPTLWTNCTAADPCREVASFDIGNRYDVLAIADAAGQLHELPETSFEFAPDSTHLLLQPGRYTVTSKLIYTVHSETAKRIDTFDLAAGHRYQKRSTEVSCSGLFRSSKEVRAGACGGNTYANTSWIEDVVTKRVVAGQKWCSNDAECPASQCRIDGGLQRAVCDIPELQCSYGESCVPR